MSKGLPEDVTVELYMEHYMPRALNRYAEKLEGIDCVLLFDIRGEGGGAWTLTVKERCATVARVEAAAASPRCTFEASADDWLDLVRGRLNGPMAFMTGRFKVTGDYVYAMRLGTMLMSALSSLK